MCGLGAWCGDARFGWLGRFRDQLPHPRHHTLRAQGRTVHTAATRELNGLTKEAREIVRAMDARNRLRFEDDRQALELWVSARTVLGSPTGASKAEEPSGQAPDAGGTQGGTPGAGGDVRPAA